MEIPDYLKELKINKFRAPATDIETNLPFELLEPRIFEKFCCDLVHKKMELELRSDVFDVLPIGVSGQKQYGADIFVKELSGSQSKVTLYEVKRVKSYSLSEYKKSVDRFLKNYDSWGLEIIEFNLFIAEDISAENIALWQNEASKLSSRSISYRVIPSSTINRWIKDFPALVYKYFHPAWTEKLFGKSAIWHLENYGIWGYEESASWYGYSGVEKRLFGDSLTYINDHVKVHAFLPSLEKNSASCYIEFRNGRFSHVMITLNHKQLVKEYFSGANIPLSDATRPFLLKAMDGEDYFCDLGNCRIKLSIDEANNLCDTFDTLWDEYKRRINHIEETWRSKYFNYNSKSSEDIPLLRIKRSLWSVLLDFAKSHDSFNTTGDWSLFDSCPGWLKIYTKTSSDRMEAGYHAFIKPKKYDGIYEGFRTFDDEVVLVWQPPNDFIISQEGSIINPRYYWDAETAHDWLKDCLIPQALTWFNNKPNGTKKSLLRRIFKNDLEKPINYNPDDYVISFHEPYPNRDIKTIENIEGLLFVITRLQSFFNGGPKNIFINLECYRKLYESLSEVLSKNETADFSYFHGNLNYFSAKDMPSLIEKIRRYSIDADKGCDNTFRIDCVLRCIQVSIRDDKSHLNSYEVRSIVNNIYPLIELMEDRKLLIRQSRFFD